MADLVGGLTFKIDSKPAEEGANRVIAAFEGIRTQAEKKIKTDTVGYFNEFRKELSKLGTAHVDLSRQITEVNKLSSSLSKLSTDNVSGTLASKLVRIGEAIEKLSTAASTHSGMVQNVNNLTGALSALSAIKPPSRVAITNITDFFKAIQGLSVPRNLTSISNIGAAFSSMSSITAPSAAVVRNLKDFFTILSTAKPISATFSRNITALMGAFHAGGSGPTAATVKNFRDFFTVLGSATAPRGASAIATALATIATNATHAAAAVAKLNVELNSLRGFSSRISVSTRTAAGGFAGMTSGALSLESALYRTQGALQALGGVLALREITQQITGFQQISAGLLALTGDSEKAAQELEYVRSVAKSFGVDFQTAAKNFTQFTAAIQGTNFTAKDAKGIFEDITKTSRVLGLSVADTDGVFRALTQIISKGSLQMEELRGQLGDRIPGAVNKMAQALGVSTAELVNMTKNGEVTGEVLREGLIKFAQLYADQTGPGLERALGSLSTQFANLGTTFSEFSVAIGRAGLSEALGIVIKAISDLMTSASNSGTLKVFGDILVFIANGFATLIRNIDLIAITAAIGGVISLFINLGAAITAVGAAFAANPVGLAVAAFAGLLAVLGALNTEIDYTLRIQEAMDGANESLAAGQLIIQNQYEAINAALTGYNSLTGEAVTATDELAISMEDLGTKSMNVLATQMINSATKLGTQMSDARNQIEELESLRASAGSTIDQIIEDMNTQFIGMNNGLDLSEITKDIADFRSGALQFSDFVPKLVSDLDTFAEAAGTVAKNAGASAEEVANVVGNIRGYADDITNAANSANDAAVKIATLTTRLQEQQKIYDVMRTGDPIAFVAQQNLLALQDRAEALIDSMNQVDMTAEQSRTIAQALGKAWADFDKAMADLKVANNMQDVQESTDRAKLALLQINGIFNGSISPVKSLVDVLRELFSAQTDIADSSDEVTKGMQTQIDKLNEQLNTIGATADQVAEYNLSMIDWTSTGQGQIDILQTINGALKDYESALKSGEQASIEQAQTALDNIAKQLDSQVAYGSAVQGILAAVAGDTGDLIEMFLVGSSAISSLFGALGSLGSIGSSVLGMFGIKAGNLTETAETLKGTAATLSQQLEDARNRIANNTPVGGGGGGGSTSRQGEERQSSMEQLMAKLQQQVTIENQIGIAQAQQKAILEGINAAKSDYNAGLRDSLELTDEERKRIEDLSAQAYARDQIRQAMEDTRTEAEKLAAAYAELEELKPFAKTQEELDAINESQKKLNETTDFYKNVVQGVGNAFKEAFESAILKAEDLNSVLINLLNTLAQIAWQQGIAGPLGDWFGGLLNFGGGSSFSGAIQPAIGMGMPYQLNARGNVYDRPFTFPMAQGKVGLGAEAGPEGLVPLTRMSNGDLGVATSGAGGGGIHINAPAQFIIQGGSEKDKEAISNQVMKDYDRHFEQKVVQIILNERRHGGALSG